MKGNLGAFSPRRAWGAELGRESFSSLLSPTPCFSESSRPGHKHSPLEPAVLGRDQGTGGQGTRRPAARPCRGAARAHPHLHPLRRPPPGSPEGLQAGSSPRPWLQHQSQIPRSPRTRPSHKIAVIRILCSRLCRDPHNSRPAWSRVAFSVPRSCVLSGNLPRTAATLSLFLNIFFFGGGWRCKFRSASLPRITHCHVKGGMKKS